MYESDTRKTTCCVTVRTASIIISWILMILGVIGVLGGIVLLVFVIMKHEENYRRIYPLVYKNVLSSEEIVKLAVEQANKDILQMCAFLVFAIAYLPTSVLLNIGVHKRNHKLMFPWVVFVGAYLVLLFSVIFLYSWFCGIYMGYMDFRSDCVLLGTQMYFYYVIYTYYKELKDKDEDCFINKQMLKHEYNHAISKPITVKVVNYYDN